MATAVLSAVHSLRSTVPTAALVTASVPHFAAGVAWRILSAGFMLPEDGAARGVEFMWNFYQQYVLFIFEQVSGVQIILYDEVDDLKEERAIYISNHQCTVDWVVSDMVASEHGAHMMGRLRFMLKDALQYFPMYGWYFYTHGCVYVRRAGMFQQAIAQRQLDALTRLGRPYWLVIFPEGTRYNPSRPESIAASRRHCRDAGLPELEHVLAPRARGLALALQQLRPQLDCIYDVTVAYSAAREPVTGTQLQAPSMFDFVCGPRGTQLHVHRSRVPIADVPEDEAALRRWLHERFAEKDRLLSYFHSPGGGHFPSSVAGRPRVLPLRRTAAAAVLYSGLALAPVLCFRARRAYAAIYVLGGLLACVWIKIRRGA